MENHFNCIYCYTNKVNGKKYVGQSVDYIKSKGGNTNNLSLYGQEKNLNTWAICKMNLLLHGLRCMATYFELNKMIILEPKGSIFLFKNYHPFI